MPATAPHQSSSAGDRRWLAATRLGNRAGARLPWEAVTHPPLDNLVTPVDDFLTGSGISVDMLLCDSAQVANGKLFVLGGGLAVVGPKPQPLALAFHISVPWDQADQAHRWRIDLVDEDGRPVVIRSRPLVLTGKFQPRRGPGIRPGTPLGVSMAINISPFPLEGGKGYAFGLSVDDQTQPSWRVRFFVRGEG